MSKILRPNQNILFMKVGVHARETLKDIVARKKREIEAAGYAFWGYGGNTCHPITKVNPFVQEALERKNTIYLCMQEIESSHYEEPIRAESYSCDGINYKTIPREISVLGSRYAVAIKDLELEEFNLPLDKTIVSIGDCKGRRGDKYIKGRVDKACLTLVDDVNLTQSTDEVNIKVSLVAEVCEPFAVLLKN